MQDIVLVGFNRLRTFYGQNELLEIVEKGDEDLSDENLFRGIEWKMEDDKAFLRSMVQIHGKQYVIRVLTAEDSSTKPLFQNSAEAPAQNGVEEGEDENAKIAAGPHEEENKETEDAMDETKEELEEVDELEIDEEFSASSESSSYSSSASSSANSSEDSSKPSPPTKKMKKRKI
jgi:hypothetical protein